MLKTKFNEQMNNALNDYKNRILALADSQQKLVMVDFSTPKGLLLLSSVSSELNQLDPGIYVGLATGIQVGIADDSVDVTTVVVAIKDSDTIVTKTWGALWYQVRNPVDVVGTPWVKKLIPADLSVIQNKLQVLTAEIRNSGILAAIDLDIENPKLIQPTPTVSEHGKMGSGLVYFSAMAGELSIPTNLIASDVTSVLASIFVLNVPERTYYYTAYHGQKVYVSTIVPSVNLTHNWKEAGGTDIPTVEALIRGLIATDVQAVDKVNNTSLMSPKAFHVAFDAALAEWVGSAPESLDTITEIAAAFQNNPDILTTMTGLIGVLRNDHDALREEFDFLVANPVPQAFTQVDWSTAPWSTRLSTMTSEEMTAVPVGNYIGPIVSVPNVTETLPYQYGTLTLKVTRVPDLSGFSDFGGTWFEFTFEKAGLTYRKVCTSGKPNPYEDPWTHAIDNLQLVKEQKESIASLIGHSVKVYGGGILTRWTEPEPCVLTVSNDSGLDYQAVLRFTDGRWERGTHDYNGDGFVVQDSGFVFYPESTLIISTWTMRVTTNSGSLESVVYGTANADDGQWHPVSELILSVTGSVANPTPIWEGTVEFKDPQGIIHSNALSLGLVLTVLP